jgi:hypothetical protein
MSVNPTQREAKTRAALEEADIPVIAKPITRASRPARWPLFFDGLEVFCGLSRRAGMAGLPRL